MAPKFHLVLTLCLLLAQIQHGLSRRLTLRSEEDEEPNLIGEDMRISEKMRDQMTKNEPLGDEWKWPGGIIHLNYDKKFNETQRSLLAAAVTEIEKKTCLQFYTVRKNQPLPPNYINVTWGPVGSGCWSWTGRQGGEQQLNLEFPACVHTATFLHLLMHAIGSFHEHSRSDRDDFVTVHFDNIEENAIQNFEKYGSSTFNVSAFPYDYHSVMHYTSQAYVKDSSIPSLESKTPDVYVPSSMSSRLTTYDARKIDRLYQGTCGEKWTSSLMTLLFDRADQHLADISAKPYIANAVYTRVWMHQGSANLTGCGFTFKKTTEDSSSNDKSILFPPLTETTCGVKTFLMSLPRPSKSYLASIDGTFYLDSRLEIHPEGSETSYVKVACFGFNSVLHGPQSLCVSQQLLVKCQEMWPSRFRVKLGTETMKFYKSSQGIAMLQCGREAFTHFDKLRKSPNDPDLLSNFCAELRAEKGEGGEEEEEEDENHSKSKKTIKSEVSTTCPALLKVCDEHGCSYAPTETAVDDCK